MCSLCLEDEGEQATATKKRNVKLNERMREKQAEREKSHFVLETFIERQKRRKRDTKMCLFLIVTKSFVYVQRNCQLLMTSHCKSVMVEIEFFLTITSIR
jgi:hypothetical protein